MKSSLCYTIFLNLLILYSIQVTAQSQQVWERKLGNDFNNNTAYAGKGFFVHETSNQQYVMMSSTVSPLTGQDGAARWTLIDTLGQVVQEQKYTSSDFPNNYIHQSIRLDALVTSDGGYAFVELFGLGDDSLALTKLDANGNLQWQQLYPSDTSNNTLFFTARLQELTNGDYLILKEFGNPDPTFGNDYRIVMQRVSAMGIPIWENKVYHHGKPSFHDNPDYIFEQANGNLVRVHRERGSIYEYDAAGTVITQVDSLPNGNVYWYTNIPIDTGSNYASNSNRVCAVTQTAEDGLIALTDKYLVEFDSTLRIKRIETIGILGNLAIKKPDLRSAIKSTNDGGYILVINNYWAANQDRNYLIKLDANWNIEWSRDLYDGSYFYSVRFYDVIPTSDHGYLLTGYNGNKTWVIKTDSLGRYKTNIIQGNVFTDYDNSCHLDSADIALQDVILKFKSNTTTSEYYAKTDVDGFYTVDVPKGTYTVELNSPFPFFDTLCPIDSTIVFLIPGTTDTFDLPLSPTISCPMPTVNIAAMILRRGLPSYYVAQYCNHGTLDAQGVYIEIELDSYFNLDSTSTPFSSQNGNTYTFNIGHLNVGDCGKIHLYGTIDTSALFGQTHCTEARIFPDSICIPNFWNGPIMNASSSCQNDSVTFQIQNTGATAANNLSYLVYEDHVIFSISNVSLGSGATTQLHYPAAPGKTYRIEVNQATGFPAILGSSKAIAFQEGCNSYSNGTFNTGYITSFYNGNSSPFVSLNCTQNRGSWDPNDKQATQKGYDAAHYIEANTPLTYKIRFQNTGTDTAFRVIIVDTLSQHLDPATLQLQVASHDYTWSLSSQGVLRIVFNNIMLPDSNVNELASHGFVVYNIQQRANNPIGTVIYNHAEIYFDFNAPVITNQTYHTIGDNFVPIIITNTPTIAPKQAFNVSVSPNPFEQATTLFIEGDVQETLLLNVYDLTGKIVANYIAKKQHSQKYSTIKIERKNLPPGIYIYHLQTKTKSIKTGKIIVR